MSSPSTAATVADLCRQLDIKTVEYGALIRRRADAEADYKSAKARRVLEARAHGAKSVAEAEMVATADPAMEVLFREYLVTDAMTDAVQKALMALRVRIDTGRSFIATERAMDSLHSQGAGGAS